MVQLVKRGRAAGVGQTAAPVCGGVAADGAVGQCGRSDVLYMPPPELAESLPLMVQFVSERVAPSVVERRHPRYRPSCH